LNAQEAVQGIETRSGQTGRLAGGLVSSVVHAVAIGLLIWWGRGQEPPKLKGEVIQAELVSLPSLVRLGREAKPDELPRLQNAPAPEAPEAIHLGKVKEEEPKKDDLEKRKEEEHKEREAEKERQRKMQQALRSLSALQDGVRGNPEDERRFQSVNDLPIGSADGSELGTASTGRLKVAYLDMVGDALRREWKISFISEEDLKRLSGKVRLIIARDRYLKSYKWLEQSGNADWNASVDACLRRFLAEGDTRFPPFPDEKSFGDSVTYDYVFHR